MGPVARSGWQAVPYIKASGRSQVLDFFEDLQANRFSDHQELLVIAIPRLEESGPMVVGPPLWVGVGGGLFEIRRGRMRVYCSLEPGQKIVMYIGREKRWREFTAGDRKLCEAGRDDYLSSQYDHAERETFYLQWRSRRGK